MIVDELLELLNNRWIVKNREPEKYFKVKDNLKSYQSFVKEKLGYTLIVNPLMIKMEKLPGKPQPWMGITEFDAPLCYVFLCCILMFLEDKEPEEQFVLAQITDYIQSQPEIRSQVDWTAFSQRKLLIKVLAFCKEAYLIRVNDGDDSHFVGEEAAVEVLYENTGLSKYFVRRFPFDITGVASIKELEGLDWQTEEGERGVMRRYRVYRRLLMEPVVYQTGSEDQEYLYIKNMRSVLTHDFEHYVGADFHLHKNGALLLFQEGGQVRDALPNRRNLSDIVLQCCADARDNINNGSWERHFDDTATISKVAWEVFLESIQKKYSAGWSKGYRELPLKALIEEVNRAMTGFGLIQLDAYNKSVTILPACGKLSGNYPKAYWDKQEEGSDDGVEN